MDQTNFHPVTLSMISLQVLKVGLSNKYPDILLKSKLISVFDEKLVAIVSNKHTLVS